MLISAAVIVASLIAFLKHCMNGNYEVQDWLRRNNMALPFMTFAGSVVVHAFWKAWVLLLLSFAGTRNGRFRHGKLSPPLRHQQFLFLALGFGSFV